VLHSQISAFEEQNSFLYFGLGLVSLSRCLVCDLATGQDQPARLSESEGKNESTAVLSPDDRFTYFTLGLVALSQRLLGDLESEPAQSSGTQGVNESTTAPPADLRNLLR
jgi:hypothetical protein